MKKIILYTCGDSTKLSTWSNVPYLFSGALERSGVDLVRVDISPSKVINRIFNTLSFYLFRKVCRFRACPEFHRTWLHRFIVYRRMKKVANLYPDAKLNLFLSYGFTNPYSSAPSVLWCDWTDEIVIQRLGRSIKWYEIGSIKHERCVMKQASAVYTMFPKCREQMEQMYGRAIVHLNRNVVNDASGKDVNIDELVRARAQSNMIIFIGNHRYRGAALQLIDAFKKLQKSNNQLELHIIGMNTQDLGCEGNKGIFCYGYLSKDDEKQRNIYYTLLHGARVFVNPAVLWGGYSSTIEAMYFACPIIVTPYADFIAEYGDDISFGRYLKPEDDLADSITSVMNSERYTEMCYKAHEMVADYTWDNYMRDLLADLRSKGLL